MNPVCDFKGQVALVTGAAKGMGLATAGCSPKMERQSCWPASMADLCRTRSPADRRRRRNRDQHGLRCCWIAIPHSPAHQSTKHMCRSQRRE